MWDSRFWIFFILVLILAGVSAAIRKLRFIDVQIMIMIAALTMSCDMLFCKQYHLYNYVSTEYKGWYSFWANLIIIPALGLVFIKFIPKTLKGVAAYIAVWTALSTTFEILIAKPLGILIYSRWRIIPYSVIGYILVFTWEYAYYRILVRYYKKGS
ncbi:MAG: hypothetical protein K0R80_3405 [Clostridia bacterium]|nr:hypothetical protein [Clostridia bacterium]